MKVTITFDNGPDPDVTPEVLDVLRARGVPSTFFVVGEKLRDPRRHDVMRRAYDEGHWIGNHTFNHLVQLGRSYKPGISEREILRTTELIGDIAHPDKFFRPMGGGGVLDENLLDQPAFELLQEDKFSLVLWNTVPGDWRAPDDWVEPALARCIELDWALVVLHDLPTGAMAHLDSFLGRVADAGGQFYQEFPDDCVPLRRGEVTGSVDQYVKPSVSPM